MNALLAYLRNVNYDNELADETNFTLTVEEINSDGNQIALLVNEEATPLTPDSTQDQLALFQEAVRARFAPREVEFN